MVATAAISATVERVFVSTADGDQTVDGALRTTRPGRAPGVLTRPRVVTWSPTTVAEEDPCDSNAGDMLRRLGPRWKAWAWRS